MQLKLNTNSIKTPDEIKSYKGYKNVESTIDMLAKKLQRCDDIVDVDFNSNKGEVETTVHADDTNVDFTGYAKFNNNTGKLEVFTGEFIVPDNGKMSKSKIEYKENEKEKIIHMEEGSEFGDFIVNKENGDIDCNISPSLLE